jgi:PleD family two-component response regulator
MAETLHGRAAEIWDRSHTLVAWSRALLAQSRRLVRPVFRGSSDSDGGMIRVTDLTGIRIMVVDDDEDTVDLLATFLRVCGATVLTARSAGEALTYLNARPPINVLLTDLAMPGVSGAELSQTHARPSAACGTPGRRGVGLP